VSALKSIIKSIQNIKKTKQSPRIQYILSVLAMSAIADKVMANEQPIQKEGIIIDVVKLLKDQGILVTPENINDIVLALIEGQEGQLIDLGYGLYQFIPANAQAVINLQISSVLLDFPITIEISLIDFAPIMDSTTLFAESDDDAGESSGYEFSLPMLGLLAVAAAGGNSNSSAPAPTTVNPFEGDDAGADLSYVDALNATSDPANASNLVYSEFSLGTFEMRDSAGNDVVPFPNAIDVVGSFIIDSTTGLGIGSFSSETRFFGSLWNAHDVAIQLNDDGTTAELNMLFDWGATSNIFVTLDVTVTMDGDQITSFTTVHF